MVIICPECTTKFKINPDRIPEGGSKVRCARCKAVFEVSKEAEAPAPELQEEDTPVQTEQQEQQSPATDFSYERFQELDDQQEAEEFSFSGETTKEDEDTSDTEDFSFSEPEKPVKQEEEEVSQATATTAVQQDLGDEKTPEFSTEADAQEESETEQLYQQLQEKKSSPASAILRILLLLILAVLVAVGVFVYINGPDKLNETIGQLLGQQTVVTEPSGQITLTNLEGKFLRNNHVGEVFLIRGEAINNFAQARSSIQVKGIIFDQSGQPLLQKTVFCGNPIADEEIAERPFEDLEKMMGNQFGKSLSNMKVNAKQTIPFDIVFKDLPKNLSEFSVNVTASKPASE